MCLYAGFSPVDQAWRLVSVLTETREGSMTMKTRKPDVYDREVERLTKAEKRRPGAILTAWRFGRKHSPLFDSCATDRDNTKCGCLTQVRNLWDDAETEALTNSIRADTRIPDDPEKVTPAHLPIFAEWQRKIDKLLGRKPPKARK